MAMVPGNKKVLSDANDDIIDLKDGLKFLRPRMDGVELVKRVGLNGEPAKAYKKNWVETALAIRSETITLADGTGVTLTVADAYAYQVNDLIRIEAEIVRVTAQASATTLTIVRGYAGTTGAAHAAKQAINLGSADPENSAAPAGMSDSTSRLYNFVQTFTRGVDLSNDEIANANVEGNPLTGNLARRFIEWTQKFAAAFFYGVRSEDTVNNIHTMGGLYQFITTNVVNAAGALTIAIIDARIKSIVDAGGDPKVIVVGTKQKQALDALDTNLQRLPKDQHVGGNLVTQSYQSGILDHSIDIIVDLTIRPDELWVLDTDLINIHPLVNNGVDGNVKVYDATTPGQDGEKKVIRGKYTMSLGTEKGHALAYGLT